MEKKISSFLFRKNLPLLVVIITIFIFENCTKVESKNDAILSSITSDAISAATTEATCKISAVSNGANVITLATQSADDSILVQVKTYNKDSLSHHWHFTKTGTGIYRISCGYSGKVLATRTSAAVEGQQLLQLRYDTSDNQLWQINKNANGLYRFINKATGYSVTLESNGTVTQRAFAAGLKQFWDLTSVAAIYSDVDANNFFRRTQGWIASDGASSVPLNDGRVAWFMGDSHIDDYFSATGKVYCLFQVRNAGLLQPASHSFHWPLTTTLKGNPYPGFQSYFKNKPNDDYWMWPGDGFQVAGNDTLYVYNQPLKKTGNGAWDWADDSLPVWAKIRTSDMKVVQYAYLEDFNGINFGMGYSEESDGYIYAYGIKGTFIYCNLYVARFPKNIPNAKWTFWTGSAWTNDIHAIKRIGQGVSNGTCIVKYQGKYICISTEFSVGCDQGTHLYASVSNSPTGPFPAQKIFYTIPDRLQGHVPFFYSPNAHPELNNTANELLITYDINGYGDCVTTCKNGRMDPDLYRPKAIRVPFSLISK